MSIAYRAPSHPGMGYPAFVDPQPPGRPPGRPPRRVPTDDAPAFPHVDDQLVRPETREELVDGQLVLAAPAQLPHAKRQARVVTVAELSASDDYDGATELLTRTGPESDFATDACILRKGIDPTTGRRYLEELVFEVVAEQSLPSVTKRARDLAARGVRRIIAVFVKTDEVREWSREHDDWLLLDPAGVIDDPTLVAPLPVRALIDGTAANDAVVRALYAKRTPALLEIEQGGVEQGRAQMARTAIEALCEVLDLPLDEERRALLQALDATRLESLLDTIRTVRRWP